MNRPCGKGKDEYCNGTWLDGKMHGIRKKFYCRIFMTPKIRYISRICRGTPKFRYIATICRGDEKWVSARAKNSFQIVSNMKEF